MKPLAGEGSSLAPLPFPLKPWRLTSQLSVCRGVRHKRLDPIRRNIIVERKTGMMEEVGSLIEKCLITHKACFGCWMNCGKYTKAVIPGGSSTPVLRPDEIDVNYDIESMAKIGTMAARAP
jgi:hypothetical protein